MGAARVGEDGVGLVRLHRPLEVACGDQSLERIACLGWTERAYRRLSAGHRLWMVVAHHEELGSPGVGLDLFDALAAWEHARDGGVLQAPGERPGRHVDALGHILDEVAYGRGAAAGVDEETFLSDATLQRAFIRSLELVWEMVASRVPELQRVLEPLLDASRR